MSTHDHGPVRMRPVPLLLHNLPGAEDANPDT